ncbi:MAG TPA: nucleotide disphospho-sugar-binding domain-containing protein [Actinophytocola sp.]|uniref:glycosyltransferase n=1 Tax=Actinophytocola sp. TaxID=1872138 RepID=UPI002E02F082|nr:nucleotide disphospho-sugar-binding domain-containing protein [Actinophytocola sp.]
MDDERPLTILFAPESAYGPTNHCIGLGNILLKRGHRVVFASESSWKNRLEPLGFVEALIDLAEPPADPSGDLDAGKFWADFIAETAPEFRKPTLAQLESFIQPTYQALIDGAMYCEPHLREIIAEHKPDVIVQDNVVGFPALTTTDAPFVRIMSCNPLEVRGDKVPPTFSGYPVADQRGWEAYRAEFDRTLRPMWATFDGWVQEQGAEPLPDLEFIATSKVANIYLFPAEADYAGLRPLDWTWHRLDSSVRETDAAFELPDVVRDRPEGSGLVYLSLGSLGGADVDLMQRLVDVLATTRHRYIVSKGPQADRITLAGNMYGDAFLPQTSIIGHVDLVITHGGNNTTTEALHFGKPMIVLPLFWDQYDNAQRIDELGFGRRLSTYSCTDRELTGAVDALLADQDLRERLARIGEQIRSRDGLRKGAAILEHVAQRQRAVSP